MCFASQTTSIAFAIVCITNYRLVLLICLFEAYNRSVDEPIQGSSGGSKWTRTTDLTLIRRAL